MNKESIFHNMSYVKKSIIILFILIFFSLYYKMYKVLYLALGGLLFMAFFFRNNTGIISKNKDYFISPCMSQVKRIYKENNKQIIYTYLSPLDKHFMIAPVDCTIIDIKSDPIYATDAERTRVTFKDANGKIFSLDQIVSKLGRGAWLLKFLYKSRCVVLNKVGDKLKQGERYGLIRFGSNMQYNLPRSYKILCNPNKKTPMGTIIAKIA